MYNKELKERFITEFSTNIGRRHTATVMFDALEQQETQWGADICTRSKEELKPVVGDLIGFRESSQKTRLTILRAYVKWCIKNHVEGACDELLKIEDFGLDKLKRQMVANPQHLQRYLNCILEKESEQTVDNVFRCYYWLAYGGVSEEDAFELKTSDVDLTEMVVRYNGVEYPIYREAIPAFKNCIELQSFKFIHPNIVNKDVYKSRATGDKLLRGISEKKSIKAMRVEMSKRQKTQKYRLESTKDDTSLDLQLSFYRVGLSGLFYRTYEAERAGMPADFMAAAEQFMEGKTYKLDSGRNLIGAKQRRVAVEYLEDYKRWKEAYAI